MILLSNFRVIAAHWDQRPFKWLSETWRHTKPRFAITNGAIERDTTPFKKHKWQSSSIIGNNEWKLGLFAVKIKHFFLYFQMYQQKFNDLKKIHDELLLNITIKSESITKTEENLNKLQSSYDLLLSDFK